MVSVQDDTLDEVPLQEEDGMEFRILMAYAQRTLPNSKFQHLMSRTPVKKRDGVTSNGEGHADGENSAAPPKKEKKKKRRWKLTPKCLRPPREEEEEEKKKKVKSCPPENAEELRVRGLAERLKDIVQRLERRDQERPEFRGLRRQASIQHDGDGEEDLFEKIIEILRREGDKINVQIVQQQSFFQRLQSCWSYGFFQRLTETYVAQMVPEDEPEDAQQSSKIALCVHATTTLTALDNHPMNRMFGFGARYLKENYSEWIKEHGGWEKVMGTPNSQEEEESEEE